MAAKLDYKAAFDWDTVCRPQIKCTYAWLYNKNGIPAFSLNTQGFGDRHMGEAIFHPGELNVDGRELVPITVSQDVRQILTTYVNDVARTDKGTKRSVGALMLHFAEKTAGKKKIYVLEDPVFYVKPVACWWNPKAVEVDNTVTKIDDGQIVVVPTAKQKLTGKQKLALAAAAFLALFNN